MTQFDVVAAKIQQTFDPLINQLIARRNALLHQLSQLLEEYTTKETTRKAAIQELENTRKQLQEMSRVNTNILIHEQATKVYQKGLHDLQAPTKLAYPLFRCPTMQTLRSAISEFGEIQELEVPDYSLTAGRKGNSDDELMPAGLALDEDSQQIYVADFGNSQVQVMSFQGELLAKLGQDVLKLPWGIAVSKDSIFVTDAGNNSLFKFCKNNHEIINLISNRGFEERQLDSPRGICIDFNEDVFVANCKNNRVSIFSSLLQFKFNLGDNQLFYPRDVKLTPDCVVVIDWSPRCVHLFSRNGDYLSSCVSQGWGQDCLVCQPRFFCLDLAGNIIISDYDHHCIKIFTQLGEFIHSIGRKGKKRREFIYPYGIAISKLGKIFISSQNPNYSLQSLVYCIYNQ